MKDVLQYLSYVRLLVVKDRAGRLKSVLNSACYGPHDGHGRLQIAAVQSLCPCDVRQGADEDIFGVLFSDLSLQVGHGDGLAVGHVGLCTVPLRVDVLCGVHGHGVGSRDGGVHAVPLGKAGCPDGTRLYRDLANGSPVPLELS